MNGQAIEHIHDHRVVDAVLVDGLPEALSCLVLATLAKMLVDHVEVKRQVLRHPVPVPVGQDEASEIVGMDDGMLLAAADRGQREPGDPMLADQLGLGVDGDRVSRQDV